MDPSVDQRTGFSSRAGDLCVCPSRRDSSRVWLRFHASHVVLYVAESSGLMDVGVARLCVHQIKRYVCLALLHTEQIPPALFHVETMSRNHANNGVDSLVFLDILK